MMSDRELGWDRTTRRTAWWKLVRAGLIFPLVWTSLEPLLSLLPLSIDAGLCDPEFRAPLAWTVFVASFTRRRAIGTLPTELSKNETPDDDDDDDVQPS